MGEGWPWNEKTHILLLPRILPSLSVPICKLGLYLPLQGCCGGLRNIVIPDLTAGFRIWFCEALRVTPTKVQQDITMRPRLPTLLRAFLLGHALTHPCLYLLPSF